MKKAILAMLTGLLITAAANAQSGPPPRPGGPGPRGAFGPGFGFMHQGKVVTGAPYSADVNNVSVQSLPDGNTIQHTTTGHVARDSQGRTYEQITTTGGPMGQVTMTFITDPVAGYAYTLNSQKNTAVRRAIKTPTAGAASWQGQRGGGPRGNAHSNVNHVENDLGTQNVNGVSAQGKSVTDTIPAGAVGNTQPIVSTRETWYSPTLQIPVMAKHNDPRAGQSTFTLTNIQTSEPPASLFQVPGNYTVTDAPTHGPRRGGPRPGNPQ